MPNIAYFCAMVLRTHCTGHCSGLYGKYGIPVQGVGCSSPAVPRSHPTWSSRPHTNLTDIHRHNLRRSTGIGSQAALQHLRPASGGCTQVDCPHHAFKKLPRYTPMQDGTSTCLASDPNCRESCQIQATAIYTICTGGALGYLTNAN